MLDADANALSGKDVLSGLVQLATHVLRICSAAQSSLVQWLSTAGSAPHQPAAAMPASEDDSGCQVIDLTADDDNDSAHDAAGLACMQHQNSAPPHKAADTAEAGGAAELAAANCCVGRPPEFPETGTSGSLPDEARMAELCMLDAYGMDLVAVISCMLHHFEEWPGMHMDLCICACVRACVHGCALVSVLVIEDNGTSQQADLMQLGVAECMKICS